MLNPSFPLTDPVIAYMHRYYILHVVYHAALSFPPESLVKELPRSLWRFSMQKEMSPCDRAHNDFLLTFYSNYGSISCRFWDIQCRKKSWRWNRGQRSLKVVKSVIIR